MREHKGIRVGGHKGERTQGQKNTRVRGHFHGLPRPHPQLPSVDMSMANHGPFFHGCHGRATW